jgi:hypothetical protein
MSCSNCFNGCSEIVSDQCVRYTGIDVPVLGIKNGDSLSFVEQALITFLTSTLDGSGIKVDINPTIICNLVKQYLPTCGDLTVVDFLTALVKAACDLQTQVTTNTSSISTINSQLSTLNAPYTIGSCITGVTPTSGTHAILQATMNALCAFIASVPVDYVSVAEFDTLIADYLASLPSSTLVSQKMVPYVAYEYYGSLTQFDSTGAGTGDWTKIYLCNGLNGTPDRRGVVAVGAIASVPGGPLASAVNPAASPFNPNYAFAGPIVGANSVTLTTQQIPSHIHNNTLTVTDPGHTHGLPNVWNEGGNGHNASGGNINEGAITDRTSSETTGITVSLTNVAAGGNLPHANNQPAIACYYIMYRP